MVPSAQCRVPEDVLEPAPKLLRGLAPSERFATRGSKLARLQRGSQDDEVARHRMPGTGDDTPSVRIIDLGVAMVSHGIKTASAETR